jgi:hypothetical protein
LKPYSIEIEQEMKKFYQSLSEKDKRRYAAVEVLKLGQVLGCHRSPISTGMSELKDLAEDSVDKQRIRKSGGGRNPYGETHPDMDEKFLDVIREYTAGDPMDETIYWTNLSPQEIANRLAQAHQIKVSVTVTRKLLAKARHYLFKADLQVLADEIGKEIRIAHYPPFTSKYNPIEHRLFPHITPACQGILFKRVELVKHLMERTHT